MMFTYRFLLLVMLYACNTAYRLVENKIIVNKVMTHHSTRTFSRQERYATDSAPRPLSNPQLNRQFITKTLKNMAKVGIAAVITSSISRPSSAAQTLVLPECSDSISVFDGNNREIVLIGTAHISDESANLVRRTIRKIEPDVVMIELDLKRLAIATKNLTEISKAGFDIPPAASGSLTSTSEKETKEESRPSIFAPLVSTVRGWIGRAAGGVLGSTISQFYKSVEKLGFKAGGEFQAAVEEGKLLPKPARILLGDRDVDVTLERLASAVTSTSGDRYSHLPIYCWFE
jgi:molybdopterin-binding protein